MICQAQHSPDSNSALPSANASVPANDRVVLKVGDVQVTEAAFEQYIADLEAQQGPATLSRKKMADNYASMLMLSQKAASNHLDSSPEVLRQLAIDRMQILSNAEFAALRTQAKPRPQEISAYYNSHLDDYDVVELRRFFIFANQNTANGGGLTREQAKALADAVRQALSSGGDVMKAIEAKLHSRTDVVADPEPLPFQRGALPPSLDKAAFELKEGGWTQISNGPDEYVFIQSVKRSRKELNEVSEQIEKKLEAQKLREELETLRKNTGVWIDEEYFASKAPAAGSTSQTEASGQIKPGTERGEK